MTAIERHSPCGPPSRDLHLRHPSRHARLPGRAAARLPEEQRVRQPLPGRRHRRRLAAEALVVLAAGAQRRGAEDPAQGAQGHQRHLRPRQPRRGRAAYCQLHLRRRAGRGRVRSTRRPTASGCWSSTATSSTASCATPTGSRSSATGPTARRCAQHRRSTGRRRSSAAATGRSRPISSTRSRTRCSSSPTSRTAVADEARRRGVDGVVCGHIHHAEIRTIDGILYCNDGDWVESCTALVEHFDGRLASCAGPRRSAREQSRCGRLRAGAAGGGVARTCASPSSPTPGARRSTASCARSRPSRAELQAVGHEVEVFGARPLQHHALPDLSRDPAGAVPGAAARTHARSLRARCHPYRHRRAARPGGAALLPAARHPLHHRLSHALPRICPRPPPACRWPGATRSCAGSTRRRRPSWSSAQRSRDELTARGFANLGAVVARRRHRRCSSRGQRGATPRTCRGRSGSTSAGSRSRRTSRPSSPSTCRAPRWWSATGRSATELQRRYPQDARFFGSVDTARSCRRATPPPTVFVFPSRTDTFGLVMLEALASRHAGRRLSGAGPARRPHRRRKSACWTRTCAPPASRRSCDPAACRAHAETFTWAQCATQFRNALRPIPRSTWQPLKRRVGPERGVLSAKYIDSSRSS